MDEIYLDNASTTKVMSEAAEAMSNCMLYDYGNPSSTHSLGVRAANRLKEARAEIASVISVSPSEIVFTSGGTEANNIAVLGAAYLKRGRGMHCITTSIEHPSVLNAFKRLAEQNWEVSYLPVGSDGIIRLDQFERLLRKDTVLVSIMHINNEIGSIQPIKEIGSILGKLPSRPLFHVDAVQSFCKYSVDPIEWGAHMVSLSAHKIHASKGVGALYIKKGIKLQPITSGGEQEAGIRSGTENVPGIVGMAEAVRVLRRDFEGKKLHLSKLKRLFYNGLNKIIPSLCMIGPGMEDGACHILSVSVSGIPAQVLQRALSAKGVHVGIGAACSSKKRQVSHVLDAIGLETEKKRCAIRISFSYTNTEEQIKKAIIVFGECFNELTIK